MLFGNDDRSGCGGGCQSVASRLCVCEYRGDNHIKGIENEYSKKEEKRSRVLENDVNDDGIKRK